MRANRAGRPRGGFTLLELLIAMAIIAILATLTTVAVIRYIDVQKGTNTKNAITKLTQLLRKRWNSAVERARMEAAVSTGLTPQAQAYVQAIAGTSNADLQRVVWVKLRLRQEFPVNFQEALSAPPAVVLTMPTAQTINPPTELQPLAVYQAFLQKQGVTSTCTAKDPGTNVDAQSAACLLMALQRQDSAGGYKPEELGAGSVLEFPVYTTAGTATGTKIKALVDGWNQPLAFYRVPWGSTELNPGGAPSGVTNDTTDSLGTLCSQAWQSDTSTTPNYYSIFQTVFGYAPPPVSGGLNSFKLQPLLVSPGPDRTLGLDLTTAAETSSAAKDDLSNADQ
jgi:prepilin-type N-terminal cleavage/methylation domain-containing protein